jgi:hypothetical protein
MASGQIDSTYAVLGYILNLPFIDRLEVKTILLSRGGSYNSHFARVAFGGLQSACLFPSRELMEIGASKTVGLMSITCLRIGACWAPSYVKIEVSWTPLSNRL